MIEVAEPAYLWAGVVAAAVLLALAAWALRRRRQTVAYLPLWREAARRSARRWRTPFAPSLLLVPLVPLLVGAGMAGVGRSKPLAPLGVFLDDRTQLARTGGWEAVLHAAQQRLMQGGEEGAQWYAASDASPLASAEAYRARMQAGGQAVWGGGEAALRRRLEDGGRALWVGARAPEVAAPGLQVVRVDGGEDGLSLRGWREKGRLWGAVSNAGLEPVRATVLDGRGRTIWAGELEGGTSRVIDLGGDPAGQAGATAELVGALTVRVRREPDMPAGVTDAGGTETVFQFKPPVRYAAVGEGLEDVRRFLRVWQEHGQESVLPRNKTEDADVLYASRWPGRLPERTLILIAPAGGVPGADAGRMLRATYAAAAGDMREELPDAALRGMREVALREWLLPAGARVLAWAGTEDGERQPLLAQWEIAGDGGAAVRVLLLAAEPGAFAKQPGFAVLLAWLAQRAQQPLPEAEGYEAGTIAAAVSQLAAKDDISTRPENAGGRLLLWAAAGVLLLLAMGEWIAYRRGVKMVAQ